MAFTFFLFRRHRHRRRAGGGGQGGRGHCAQQFLEARNSGKMREEFGGNAGENSGKKWRGKRNNREKKIGQFTGKEKKKLYF